VSSGVVCSALGVMENPIFPGSWKDELAFLAGLNQSGGRVYAESQVRPLDMTFSLSGNWIGAFYMRHWAPIMLSQLSDRKALFADPARRNGLIEDLNHFQSVASLITVLAVASEENRKYVGRTIAEIADSERKTLADALIDISITDDLKTQFDWSNVFHADSEAVAAILQNPFILLGGSDAGAHVAQFSGEGDATHLLAHYVREKGYLSLEQGIALLTGNLASTLGIKGRGRIQQGYFADLVIFDIERLGRGPQHLVHDLPGGGARFMRHATGINSVFVNGELVWNGTQYLSKKSGRLV
jgi:N-acyl-D-aspartate/D-glutamate deacylase